MVSSALPVGLSSSLLTCDEAAISTMNHASAGENPSSCQFTGTQLLKSAVLKTHLFRDPGAAVYAGVCY